MRLSFKSSLASDTPSTLRARRRSLAMLSSAALLSATSAALAVTQTSTWTGATSTNWNDATNWSPNNTSPNNGNAGISDFNATIVTATNQPTLTAPVTIDVLTLNTGTTLTIGAGVVLNVNGPTLTNNGTIQIDTFSSNAALNFTANTTVSGTGTIFLDDVNPNARIIAPATVVVTMGAGQTINGVGEIDAALINNGTVNANVGSRIIAVQTANVTNNNLLEASNSGNLSIANIFVTQGAGGTISNNGGTVSISNTTISGGTFGAGVINVSNISLNSVSIAAGATVVITAGSTLNYSGATFANNGTLQVDTLGSNADLNFNTTTSITGSGTIVLNDYSPFARLTSSPGAIVTVGASQTIDGVGEIDAALVNNGVINSNSTLGSRTILLQTNNMTNNNLIEATGGSTLAISGITITQSATGNITNAASIVTLGNATISGGTLTGGSFSVTSNSTFSNLTIAASASVIIQSAVVLNYTTATLTNNGVIQIDNLSSNGDLNFTGNTSIAGAGSIVLNDYSPNARLTAAAGATVTVGAGQTIYGVGEIDAALINNGVINANSTVGSLTILLQTNNMTNNNIIKTTGTGLLTISGITLTQSPTASISNLGGGVTLTNATISGGTLSGGLFEVNANSTLSNITVAAATTVRIDPAVILNYTGPTLTNNGTIQIDNVSSNAALNFTGNTTVNGTGSLFLDDWGPNARITAAANATVTFGSTQSVYGIGEIDASIVNNGTITANATVGTHTVLFNGQTNNANLIRATGTGIATFAATSLLANGSLGNGTIQVDAGSAATFTGLTSYTNAGTISLTAANASFTGLTSLTNAGTIALVTGASITLPGSLTGTTLGIVSGNGTVTAGSLFGKLAIQGGAVRVTPNGTNTGASKLTSLSLAGSTNAWASALDLTNNKLVVEDSTITHNTTLSTLQNEAFYGRTHATGITSSALPANAVIAVAENAAFATPFSTFGGQTVDAGSILVAPELLGDANFDGKVDLNDLNTVLNHLGVTTSAWTSGNFDGAATIDLNDLNAVLNHLGTTLSISPSIDATILPATAPTPEPASLLLLTPLALCVLRRRTVSV